MKKKEQKSTTEVENRKARHLYQVLETLEVGVSLKGTEVKSIRNGRITIGESWIEITKELEFFLVDCHIEEYVQGNQFNHQPTRRRKLLAHRAEIIKFSKAKELKGLTIIPLKLYFNKKGFVKLLIGLCKGKDQGDKRQDLMKRQQNLEMNRAIKMANR